MMKIKSRKSQSEFEMMMMPVIILIIGIISVAVRLGLIYTEKPASPQREYITNQYANDVVDVILRVTTKCRGLSFKDLIQDCEKTPPDDVASEYYCDPQSNKVLKCAYAKNQIQYLLDTDLKDTDGLDYYFIVYKGADIGNDEDVLEWINPDGYMGHSNVENDDFTIGIECPSSRRSKTYQLPGSISNIFVKLDICI